MWKIILLRCPSSPATLFIWSIRDPQRIAFLLFFSFVVRTLTANILFTTESLASPFITSFDPLSRSPLLCSLNCARKRAPHSDIADALKEVTMQRKRLWIRITERMKNKRCRCRSLYCFLDESSTHGTAKATDMSASLHELLSERCVRADRETDVEALGRLGRHTTRRKDVRKKLSVMQRHAKRSHSFWLTLEEAKKSTCPETVFSACAVLLSQLFTAASSFWQHSLCSRHSKSTTETVGVEQKNNLMLKRFELRSSSQSSPFSSSKLLEKTCCSYS